MHSMNKGFIYIYNQIGLKKLSYLKREFGGTTIKGPTIEKEII